MRYALIFTWAIGLAAGAEHDPLEVLRLATQKVLASAREIPNYTCVETVTRDYFAAAAASLPRACPVLLELRRHPTPDVVLWLYSRDRLRLDVTMADKGEIYSWSGASRFEDADIDRVVRYGPISTGSFGGTVVVVFQQDVKKFNFERAITANHRTLMEYSFQVPQSDSHYSIKAGNSFVPIPYGGTFQVDAETADVVQMTLTSGELPLATGVCLSTTTMDLTRVQIGDGQFLLPKQARQHFVYQNAEETANTTSFADCREFRGESTVTFSPDSKPAASQPAKSASAAVVPLPPGLRFSCGLTAPVSTGAAAAGDPFSARLLDAIRGRGGKLLAPKGTLLDGHLLRVQSFFRPPEVVVVFKPEALWIHGARVPLSVERDWNAVHAEARRRGRKAVEILLPLQGEENAGVFRFSGQYVVVPDRFRSDWRTVPVAGSVPARQ